MDDDIDPVMQASTPIMESVLVSASMAIMGILLGLIGAAWACANWSAYLLIGQ